MLSNGLLLNITNNYLFNSLIITWYIFMFSDTSLFFLLIFDLRCDYQKYDQNCLNHYLFTVYAIYKLTKISQIMRYNRYNSSWTFKQQCNLQNQNIWKPIYNTEFSLRYKLINMKVIKLLLIETFQISLLYWKIGF